MSADKDIWKPWQRADGSWTARKVTGSDSLIINHRFTSEEDAEWAANEANAHDRIIVYRARDKDEIEALRAALQASQNLLHCANGGMLVTVKELHGAINRNHELLKRTALDAGREGKP